MRENNLELASGNFSFWSDWPYQTKPSVSVNWLGSTEINDTAEALATVYRYYQRIWQCSWLFEVVCFR